MGDKQRYRKEFSKPRYFAVDSATVIELGDNVWLDTDDVKPASDFTWDTDLATTQTAFAQKYKGVAADRSQAGETDDIMVHTAGVHDFDCASATFETEDFLGPAKASGNALENQKVVAVATAALSTGKVAKRETSTVTSVSMDVRP